MNLFPLILEAVKHGGAACGVGVADASPTGWRPLPGEPVDGKQGADSVAGFALRCAGDRRLRGGRPLPKAAADPKPGPKPKKKRADERRLPMRRHVLLLMRLASGSVYQLHEHAWNRAAPPRARRSWTSRPGRGPIAGPPFGKRPRSTCWRRGPCRGRAGPPRATGIRVPRLPRRGGVQPPPARGRRPAFAYLWRTRATWSRSRSRRSGWPGSTSRW